MSVRKHEFPASRYPSIPVSVGLRYPWWRLVAASGAVVVVALFAHWIWGEAFGRTQILALVLIGAGVYLLGREA